MGRIKPQKPPGGGKIPAASPPPNPHLTLSFKHFRHREPFVFPGDKPNYPLTLLERLRDLCGMRPSEIRASNSRALRSHPIDWKDTTEPNGFDHLNPTLREQITPWQLTLSANEHGRIHGFWIDDVFYVVWIDPNHKLYS